MSYSFTVSAATKEEVLKKVETELDQVIDAQPCHAKDREAALGAASAFVELLAHDPTHDISVAVNGSVSYVWTEENPTGDAEGTRFTGASVSVTTWHVAKANVAA